jgi:hypothetical protein
LFEVQLRPERRFYRQMLDALSRSGFGADGLESELVISRLFGTVWASQDGRRDGSTEEAFGLGLVDYARQRRAPGTVAVLRTLAVVAPIREVRSAAASVANLLTAGGLPEPRWARPPSTLTAGACWAYEDVYGDESTVICEYGYGPDPRTAERHAILVHVDHAMFSVATDAMFADDVDPLLRDMRNGTEDAGSLFRLRQVDPAWARALLERAFARTDLIPGIHTEPSFAELRALVLARMQALPDNPGILPPEPVPPSEADRQALIDEFLASPEAQALPDPATVAQRIVEHSFAYEPGQLARVSPSKWETFAYDWLPRQAELPASFPTAFPAVARAWTSWAGRRANLSDRARGELAAALDEILADPAVRSMLART